MKIRFGFVSNSSSSSFTIYGAWVSASKTGNNINKLKDNARKLGLSLFDDYLEQDGRYCVGVDPENAFRVMNEDETLAQYKYRIKKAIDKLIGGKSDVACEIINLTVWD